MRGRLPSPPIPGQTVGGGVPDAPRRLAPTSFPGLPPAETSAAANTPGGMNPSTTALAFPLGEGGPAGPDEGRPPAAALPRANRRGRRPRCPAEACADVLPRVTTRGDSRCRQHPRRGQDPSLRTEPLTGACVNPRAGHARPLPRGGPETGAHVNPAGVSISPSVGRRPRRPAEACADVLPRVTTRGDSRCRQHPRRGQDPSLRTEPMTGVRVTPRAGHARPLPCGGPETGAHVNPTALPYPHP